MRTRNIFIDLSTYYRVSYAIVVAYLLLWALFTNMDVMNMYSRSDERSTSSLINLTVCPNEIALLATVLRLFLFFSEFVP